MRDYLFLKQPFEDWGSTPVDFTDEKVFRNIKSINGGTVEISDKRAKLGNKSLKWNYEKGSMLRVCGVDALGDLNTYPAAQGIKLWIYNPKKIDCDIIVRIGKAKLVSVAPLYRFTVNMNFEGWRAVWIRLNVSAKTILTQVLNEIETIEIEAPAENSGVMWLDAFEVLESIPYTLAADFQMPHLPLWSAGYHYASYLRTPTQCDGECTDEHKKAFELITKRLDEYILPKIDYNSLDNDDPCKIRYNGLNEFIREEVAKYDSHNIRRGEDGKVYGPGLFAILDEGDEKKRFYYFEKMWVALALDWKINKNKQSLERIMDMFDYFYDQGWAEGSACGAMMIEEMRADGYVYALFMLRDELKERGIYEREWGNLRWRSEFGYIFSYNDEDIYTILKPTCDKMRSVILYMLMYILGLDDSPLKVLYMKKYLEFFSFLTSPTMGIDNGIKTDGTLWHHQAPYMIAYGAESLNYFCLIRYVLNSTCFEIDEKSIQNIDKILDVYTVTAYKNDITTPRITGRILGMKSVVFRLLSAYAMTVLCGDHKKTGIFTAILKENESELDTFYKGKLPSIAWMETLGQPVIFKDALELTKKVENAEEFNRDGHYVLPYGGYCVNRCKDYLISVSGWSSYIWDYENGQNENVYGRYFNYGSTVITSDGRTFDFAKGLDWSNMPGTTAKYMSHEELKARNYLDCRYHSDETFLGGVTLSGGNGIYGLQMHDTAFDPSLRAKKSWFFFDNMIVALGSGIVNDDLKHNTETTLFQTEIADGDIIYVNSQPAADMVYDGSKSECVWICDTYGNGYVIPDGEGFALRRNRQSLKYHTSEDYEGSTVVAYINHGTAPENAGYEYVIMPQCDVKNLENKAKAPGYKVLQRDENAHIVSAGNVIGYVVYNEDETLSFGAVKETNTPCIIGETKLSEDEIVINISDPDLRMCDFPAESDKKHILKLTLDGLWDVNYSSNMVNAEYSCTNTIISLGTKDGMQTEIKLTLRK